MVLPGGKCYETEWMDCNGLRGDRRMRGMRWRCRSAVAPDARRCDERGAGSFGPRGLKFGPDGSLYVATSGAGPWTTATCSSVPGGPYFGTAMPSGSAPLLKIDSHGNVTTLASGFSSTFNPPTGSALGVADLAFLNGELYAVTAGGGCGHGNPSQPNMVTKVDTTTGQWTMVALS